MRDGDVVESSSGPTGQFVWAKLWNLHVPTKIKVFGWRACQDILPTRANLVKRKIIIDNTYECARKLRRLEFMCYGSAGWLRTCGLEVKSNCRNTLENMLTLCSYLKACLFDSLHLSSNCS